MKNNFRSNMPNTGMIYIVPFVIVILNCIITINHTNRDLQLTGKTAAFMYDPLNLMVLGSTYLIALVLVLKRSRQTIILLKKQIVYFLFLTYIIISMYWSLFPLKVLITWGHYVGYTLVAVASVYYFNNFPRRFFYCLCFLAGISVAGSIIVSLWFPSLTIFDHARWYGITSNPNTLGLVCMLLIWASLVSVFITKSRIIIIINVSLFLLALIALIASGSMTAAVLSVFIIVLVAVFMGMSGNHTAIKRLKLFLGACAVALVFLAYWVIHPEGYNSETALNDIGRNVTFSGRTQLWQKGMELCAQKPYLGWSFDALLSVSAKMKTNIGQFHNGYLNLAVRGGIVSLFFVLFIIIDMFFQLRSFMRYQYQTGVAFTVMILAILVHNITEASIARSTHILWFMFIFIYFYLKNYCSQLNIKQASAVSEK